MKFKISVIIPTYNRAHIVKDALESVSMQTYSNWECIIIDDGSTDFSEKVIKEFIHKDQRFKFIKRPQARIKGAATCRNIGLENATGDYIQFLDSDDFIATNKFEVQIKLLENENLTTIGTCKYGLMRPIWDKPKIFSGKNIFRTFNNPRDVLMSFAINFSYFPLHVYLIPKMIIEKAGKWNENLTVNDDGEYFSRIILNSSKIKYCGNTFAVYRTGAGNRITRRMAEDAGIQSYVESWNLIEKNIYKKTGIKNHLYVQGAKMDLYQRLNNENPTLISKHSHFLKDKWSNPSYFTMKMINKLRTKLFVSFKPL